MDVEIDAVLLNTIMSIFSQLCTLYGVQGEMIVDEYSEPVETLIPFELVVGEWHIRYLHCACPALIINVAGYHFGFGGEYDTSTVYTCITKI